LAKAIDDEPCVAALSRDRELFDPPRFDELEEP
jgi:hypothetical protein